MNTACGKPTLILHVVLKPRPEQSQQGLSHPHPQHQQNRHTRNGPSQIKRRHRRATARKVAAKKATTEVSEEEQAVLKLAEETEHRSKAKEVVTIKSEIVSEERTCDKPNYLENVSLMICNLNPLS